ncbi:protein FRA10AC1 isoform X1 [Amblyraja radiata]|uniref:protein FRA10AC1 isoform X1 n=1 Tax=Amblyraja radiata TaxID=386614 RepID=UPI0014033D8A|nr:protein FRA10AC1 isoform X1 [Amblyraja radiata]
MEGRMSGRGPKLDLVQERGYDSEFSEDEHEAETSNSKSQSFNSRTRNDAAAFKKPFQKEKYTQLPHKQLAANECDREEARNRRFHLIAMDAYERHKKYINDYLLYYGGSKEDLKRSTVNDKTDLDVIKENHRFLWTNDDEADMNWEKTLAKKYYDKLFREYCIADLSQYKHNKIGFRWRIDKEVISGKGQFGCGNKYCDVKEGLKSWEVNFGYMEHGEKRNALVKLRVCNVCSRKLNYHHRRKEVKAAKRKSKEEHHDAPAEKITKTREKQSSKSQGKSSTSRTEQDDDDSNKESEDAPKAEDPSEYWKGPSQDTEDKTKEEEFDEYFEDMFL